MSGHPPPVGTPRLVAPVSGFAAFALRLALDEVMPARLMRLREQVARGKVHPDRLREVVDAWVSIRRAADEWSTSARGSAEALPAEMPQDSIREIDTATAGALLGVTPTRVGQLIRAGDLPGRRAGGRWLVPRADVELRRTP